MMVADLYVEHTVCSLRQNLGYQPVYANRVDSSFHTRL